HIRTMELFQQPPLASRHPVYPSLPSAVLPDVTIKQGELVQREAPVPTSSWSFTNSAPDNNSFRVLLFQIHFDKAYEMTQPTNVKGGQCVKDDYLKLILFWNDHHDDLTSNSIATYISM
ncbi:hypothetical protein EJB05_26911, partial [Eragrostis curvula]